MASPFPGMDPYLEDPVRWPGLHQSLITYIRDVLQAAIRPRYNARIGERLYVTHSSRPIYPDVSLVERGQRLRETAVIDHVDVPVLIEMSLDDVREPFIEIVDLTHDGRVITVIEVLSPVNKTAGDGHEAYCRKQDEVLASQTNLIEIDLLRDGLHTVFVPHELLKLNLAEVWQYLVAISRVTARHQAAVYPISLRKRLPRIAVPLAEPDPDVALDLQAVFERSYENGAYADVIDYTRPPKVALSADDAGWAERLLRENLNLTPEEIAVVEQSTRAKRL